MAHSRQTVRSFNIQLELMAQYEERKTFGGGVRLSAREQKANKILMSAKNEELEAGMEDTQKFIPAAHIFNNLKNVQESKLYKLIHLMPKGGALNVNELTMCSTQHLLQLTYLNNLWACLRYGELDIVAFRFANNKPHAENIHNVWMAMNQLREHYGAVKVDEHLAERLRLCAKNEFKNKEEVDQAITQCKILFAGLLLFEPNFQTYLCNSFKEYLEDGIQYMEIRTTFPLLYDLENTDFTVTNTVQYYQRALDTFMQANKNFLGAKLIYAPSRNVNNPAEDINLLLNMKKQFPALVVGFDLVGPERNTRMLRDFVPLLLSIIPERIDFCFHAGEIVAGAEESYSNLLDAILLKCKRIAHGNAAFTNPKCLDMIKEQNIALEICPVTEQVLQMCTDLRLHPCTHFFANDVQAVIGSGDRGIYGTAPISHDFYLAFLGSAAASADLRFLKKLISNSIDFSGLSEREKEYTFVRWELEWDNFINAVISKKLLTDNGKAEAEICVKMPE